jgi:hypothetical protein
VLLLALVPVLAVGGLGLCLALGGDGGGSTRGLGWLLFGLAVALAVGLVHQMIVPRIAYRAPDVLFYVGARGPIAVPVGVVEAFFLGQGPANFPTAGGNQPQAVNLVARISQRAPEWAQAPVKEALARWNDGYVTLRGAWCEPLTNELVRRLNRRLREVHRPESVSSHEPED